MSDQGLEREMTGTIPETKIDVRKRQKDAIWIFAGVLLLTIAIAFNGWVMLRRPAVVQGADGPVVSDLKQRIEEREFAALYQLYQHLKEEYVEEPDSSRLLEGAMIGMVDALGDPRSHYFTPAQMRSQMEQSQGSYTGIGSTVEAAADGFVTLIFIYPDSPAERAGLISGDKLLEIDGTDAKGMSLDEAVTRVKGPRGTVVKLRILRPSEPEPFDVEIIRDLVETISVQSRMLDDEIGLMTINSFTNTTGSQFANELQKLLDAGMKGMVLDLRNNGGGTLDGLMDVANILVPEGIVFTWTFRDRSSDDWYSELKSREYEVVVLINGYSASASEVLAGALQDRGAAKLVGVRSFGKGSAQYTYRLANEGGVSFTVSRWVTPEGRQIEGQGLDPDIKVIDPYFPLVLEQDRPLKPGQIELLQAKLQALGYDAPFEGSLGEATIEALRAFQQDNLIYISGTLSDDTLQVLNKLCYERIPHENDPQMDTALQEIRKMVAGKD
ncbi:MAG: S41 family peptidase [Symbiobacteriaceae bacterium]|nr:S41 family peptidase [Symbiobacteriaceae bacterium]